MALIESSSNSYHSSIHTSRRASWAAPNRHKAAALPAQHAGQQHQKAKFPPDLEEVHIDRIEALDILEGVDALKLSLPSEKLLRSATTPFPKISIDDLGPPIQSQHKVSPIEQKRPFHRWMKSLHRRAKKRPAMGESAALDSWQQLLTPEDTSPTSRLAPPSHCRNSSSGSSLRFISAVRSASVSLASVSAIARSKRNTAHSHCHSRTDRSSRASFPGPRASEDSAAFDSYGEVDASTVNRSLQRRRILEELIGTEESYIGDVKFLMNVYITILASLPTSTSLRSSINRNLAEIIQLHEEILGDLHRVVPHSEYTQVEIPLSVSAPSCYVHPHVLGHRRWTSLDAVPEHMKAAAWLQGMPGMVSDPQVSAEVSKIFAKKMNRFFIYKEYGAKYELMMKDVSLAHRTMPEWESYQKGIEVLASTFGSVKHNKEQSRKALTIGDLLVKPIQRICKYPLLFAELLKHTPVSDCPNSHMEIDGTLIRLREVTAEINRATDDVRMKSSLEKTWLLQDRLAFPNRKLDAASKTRIRSFGHVRLCGALHVCWQSATRVDGQYMICLLYRDVLCLASAGRVDPVYTIQACINLHGIRMEDVDNGRGLQCHTAPFSWKVVFECDFQLYEIIMTACTPKEEMEWRARLSLPMKEEGEVTVPVTFGTIDLDIKSLGTVFGKPGTIARRISIHRATTVGPKSPLAQVVLKNTSVVRDTASNASSSLTINRSQSLLVTSHRTSVLAPPRSERARLEALLTDVWSREILPYPGMTTRSRSEHLVRSSASTMMRKLSVASITGSFSKRSGSLNHRHRPNEEDSQGETLKWVEATGETDEHAEANIKEDHTETEETKHQYSEEESCRNPHLEPSIKAEVEEFSGTVRRLPTRRRHQTDRPGAQPILRASSPNNLRLYRTTRSEKSSLCSIEKENAIQSPNCQARGSSRWARGMSKSEGKSHSFRSLFR